MPRAKPRASEVKVATVAIVGRPNVGKSTLLNALVGQDLAITSHHPQTTRERVLGVHTEPDLQLVLTDTPGVHTAKNKLGAFMNQEASTAAEGGDVIVFVTDVRAKGPPGVREEDLAVLKTLPAGARVVLALNKIDLIKDKAALLPHLEAWGKAFSFVDVVPISAKRRDGSDRLVEVLRGLATPGPKLFDDDTLSDRPTRYFVAEFVRGEVLRKTRQEVPHGVAVVVERWAEVRGMPHIDIAIIVDKESHKKIVVGHLGARIKEIGAAARKKVEALIGQQVHLQLWVRVVSRWYESPQRLAELGYAGVATAEGAS